MMRSPLVRTIASALVIVGMTVGGASGVSAAPIRLLPAGDSVFALPHDAYEREDGLLLAIDPTSAVGTKVGSGTPGVSRFPGQAAWNPVDRRAYWFSLDDPAVLYSLDVMTGVSTRVATVTAGPAPVSIDSLAIDAAGRGFAYAVDTLYSIDLSSGALTPIGITGAADITGMTFDPTSGVLYALAFQPVLYTIDPRTGEVTSSRPFVLPRVGEAYALQADSGGILWIAFEGEYFELGTIDPAAADLTDSVQSVGAFEEGGGPVYPHSLLIVPGTTPTFISPAGATVAAGVPFRFAVTATGSPAPVFSLSSGRLPEGVTFDSATGVLSGVAATGTTTVTITATSTAGSASQTFTLTVAPAAAVTPVPTPRIVLPVVSG